MNATLKLIRNAKSLCQSLFAAKSNEKRRWWLDSGTEPRITHRSKKGRLYDTWISPEAEEDVSLIYSEAGYTTLMSSMTIPYPLRKPSDIPYVDVVIQWRFGNSPRIRTTSLHCDWYENGGDGHGVLWVRSVTNWS